ncbi:hypothetical protein AB9B48_17120 [Kluyvera ascorbata]|uniref:hypothetical protein n=1 Tax=Kluyvera ascorbata TaxID=51288 RepID=UPI00350FBC00
MSISREKFEAWLNPLWHLETFKGSDDSLQYRDEVIQGKWEAWQAASKASEQQLAAVVAENAGLKSKAAELVHEASEVYSAYNATITEPDGDFMDMQTLQEMQCVETPATDSYLAEVRAQGVEMFVMDFTEPAVMTNGKFYNEDLVEASKEFAAQLRQGADQ